VCGYKEIASDTHVFCVDSENSTMGQFIKHQDGKPPRKPPKSKAVAPPQPPPQPIKVVLVGPESSSSPAMQHDINHVAGLAGIEESLDWIARGLGHLTTGEGDIQISLCSPTPIKITLTDCDDEDTMGRLVTAVERLADSIARLAGLSRPRLESWHEQDEYEPRYKSNAVDGGAPGPKKREDL
jgi:hypothetical protein